MERQEISTHTELAIRIMHLKAEKFRQEEVLKNSFREFFYTLQPATIIKETLHELSQDKEVQFDLAKAGLNMGANFIIDKVLGKNRSIKGYLSSLLLERVSGSFINDNVSKIMEGVGKFFKRNNQKTENNNQH
ncbi:MAG TPA: hypothetical protein VGO45_06800 [Bacteroidia bacterium]|jgi:hypothetical protein|nr:hypothetical protein [Bacteroidia bacterium]